MLNHLNLGIYFISQIKYRSLKTTDCWCTTFNIRWSIFLVQY